MSNEITSGPVYIMLQRKVQLHARTVLYLPSCRHHRHVLNAHQIAVLHLKHYTGMALQDLQNSTSRVTS